MTGKCSWCSGTCKKLRLECTSQNGEKYIYYKCSDCNSLSLFYPNKDILQKAYQTDYYGQHQKRKFSLLVEKIRKQLAGKRARSLAALLPENASVLDIGCGNGDFLKNMRSYGAFRLIGTELPGPAADRAKQQQGLTILTSPLTEDMIQDGFNMISLFHVFEHLDNPPERLKEIRSMLKPGGYLIVSMPEPESNQAMLFGKHWFHIDPPRHLCIISRKEFIKAAAALNLNPVKTSLFSAEQNPYGFIQSMLNIFFPKRDQFYEVLKGNIRPLSARNLLTIALQAVLVCLLMPASVVMEIIDLLSKKTATYSLILRDSEQDLY